MVQNRAKNTANVHRSSHSYAHTIIFYVVLVIQMHTIPIQAPNMCVYGDRHAKAYLRTIWILEHKQCKIGPKTPQMLIVYSILMHILSYFL